MPVTPRDYDYLSDELWAHGFRLNADSQWEDPTGLTVAIDSSLREAAANFPTYVEGMIRIMLSGCSWDILCQSGKGCVVITSRIEIRSHDNIPIDELGPVKFKRLSGLSHLAREGE